MHNSIYIRPNLNKGLEIWNEISAKSEIAEAAMSYRWAAYNTALGAESGDGLIVGAKSPEHLAQVLVLVYQVNLVVRLGNGSFLVSE